MSNQSMKAMQDNPDRGKLRIRVTSNLQALPISDANIEISYTGEPGSALENITTDNAGRTETVELAAPPIEYSLQPSETQPYAEYTLRISAPGFESITISGVEILSDTLALQEVRLNPQVERPEIDNIVIPAHTLYGNYPPKIAEAEIKPVNQLGEIVLSKVVVPEYVVVHDGSPRDSTASDYYIRYKDYIKNVASSEIYATWPRETIEANILAIMSFTLNRVYTEWSLCIG